MALVLKHGLDIYQYEKQLKATNEGHDVIQPVERAIARGISEVVGAPQEGHAAAWPPSAPWPPSSACWAPWSASSRSSPTSRPKGAGDINALAGSIGEALGTTALGLIVAIPAVWIYNYYTTKQDQVVTSINNAASQMIDEFIRRESQG